MRSNQNINEQVDNIINSFNETEYRYLLSKFETFSNLEDVLHTLIESNKLENIANDIKELAQEKNPSYFDQIEIILEHVENVYENSNVTFTVFEFIDRLHDI